jgi:NAD(P)-dependent dehydrogenase (short-subunit alcohol dehydrogenase family)
MMETVADKGMIIVTGASRGIGAAIAEHLARAGYDVGCLSRSGSLPVRPGAPDAVQRRWHGEAVDVTDAPALRSAFQRFAEKYRIVGLVNNAGIHIDSRSVDLPVAQWDEVMATNATSVMSGCQAVYPYLEGSGGLIINIGSFYEKLGVKRNLAYCASKAAVGAITRVLAVEWATKGIRVLNVAPGYIVTDLNRDMLEGPLRPYLEKRIPAGTPGDADDVAKLVAGLYAMDTAYLTGETLYIDGAQGVAH